MKASIIIPSYNSRERLYLNLLALNNQSYNGKDIEVIVVDNGSTDTTSLMLDNFELKYPFKKIRVEKNKGIANGRNEGIRNATGDILIFHDSDMLAEKDYILKHINAHTDSNLVVCGLAWKRIYTFYYKNFSSAQLEALKKQYSKFNTEVQNLVDFSDKQQLIPDYEITDFNLEKYAFDLDIDFIKELKSLIANYGEDLNNYSLPWRFFITNNLSVERRRVLDVGMFDAKIYKYGYEDYDLGIRLFKSGCKYKFSQDIISIHQEHPQNFTYLDLMENLAYMCNKYNNILFIDFILVCIGDTLALKNDDLNNIISEINKIRSLNKYNFILKLYLMLLQLHRKRIFSPTEDNSIYVFSFVAENMQEIIRQMSELTYKYKFQAVVNHICELLMNLLNVDMKPFLTSYRR